MTVSTAFMGASSGLFISFFSNSVRKLPLMRRPWEHVILVGIMGYLGHKYPQIEADTRERVNRMRADRKLGPLEDQAWGWNVSSAEMAAAGDQVSKRE